MLNVLVIFAGVAVHLLMKVKIKIGGLCIE